VLGADEGTIRHDFAEKSALTSGNISDINSHGLETAEKSASALSGGKSAKLVER
jgi:hypothetical protein